MSYSCSSPIPQHMLSIFSNKILIHHQGPFLSLKSNDVNRINYAKLQRRKVVVCCCPWSEKNKNRVDVEVLPQNNNLISYLLSLGPLSLIINKKGNRKKLPPTPSLLDLIGVSLHLVRSHPHQYALRDLANKYGPLMYLEVGERSVAIVSSAEIAKEVMRTHDPSFAERPRVLGFQMMSYNEKNIIIRQYDEYWKQMRNLCVSEFLSGKKVRSWERIRKEEGSALVESIHETIGVPVNVSEKIYSYTFTVVCRALFGRVPVDKGEAVMSIRKAVELMGNLSTIDFFGSIKALNFMSWHKLKLQNLGRQMDRILEDLIDIEHRSRGDGSDEEHFVDVLLRLKESGVLEYPITHDNIKPLLYDMIVPGTDTSSTLADWAMAELMKNPRVMAKAQDEIRQAFEGKETIQECEIGRLKYLKFVLMETLRLHPPVPLTIRSCREEAEVDGYHIPLKTVVIINTWAIGRDPTYWKNPESFEPERFEANPIHFSGTHFEFNPFGSGKRMCPGVTFALAQVEMVLAQLLYHFDWELPRGIKPGDLDMTDVGGITFSRKNPLYLIAKPYHPASFIANN